MKKLLNDSGKLKALLFASFLCFMLPCLSAYAVEENYTGITQQETLIVDVVKINPTTVDILFSNHQRMTLDFYGENIFRVFQDNSGGMLRVPEAKPEAKILVDQPRRGVSQLNIKNNGDFFSITSGKIKVEFDKSTALMKVINLKTGVTVLEEAEPVLFDKERVILKLKENLQEYFYGGGVQNGRFSHKGKTISIENQNSWTDGGVASPNPYYWSTNGIPLKEGFTILVEKKRVL